MATVVQLSDIHFGGENTAAVEAAVAFVQAEPPDLTLITGDITLNGLPREFAAAQAWLARLPKPWLCTPGNHDTPYWNLPLRVLTPFSRYRRYIGVEDGEYFSAAGLAVQTINTARGGQPRLDWSKGAVNLEACEGAVERLAASETGALRLVACHHPLIEAVGAPVTGGVHRGDEAARLLAEGGVDAILTGHVHNPFAVAMAAGDGLTYAIGAGTLSLRVRGTPPGFNRLRATAETLQVEAMGWTGSAYEPYRTWALPRRARR